MRLRPYKYCDAKKIISWIKDEEVFLKWGGDRFGWVVVDDSIRGKGYGTSMIRLGLKYAFNILGVDMVTIGVFENNDIAHNCYKKVGFVDKEIVSHDRENIIEMAITKEEYLLLEF